MARRWTGSRSEIFDTAISKRSSSSLSAPGSRFSPRSGLCSGDPIFFRLKPDWRTAQADEVEASCTSDQHDAFVAVLDGRPVGFVTVALNAFNEGMGVIDIIGVDPDFHRRGIATGLTRHALVHMRRCGMDIAAIGTGGDPGHAPARAAYEALGFTLLPSARYLKLLD